MYTTVIISLAIITLLYSWLQWHNDAKDSCFVTVPLVIVMMLSGNLLYLSLSAIIISGNYFYRKLSIGRGGFPIMSFIVFSIATVAIMTYCGVEFN
ncbi:MAG: hypothetical protein ACOZAJ_00260 [Patescibacteria group bacterium]